VQAVDARELHAFLEVGKDFSTWIRDRIEQYQFVQGMDYSPVSGNRADGLPGKQRTDYAISLDMAKELAMVERNEKGKQARLYFIDCERQAKDALIAGAHGRQRRGRPALGLRDVASEFRGGLSIAKTACLVCRR